MLDGGNHNRQQTGNCFPSDGAVEPAGAKDGEPFEEPTAVEQPPKSVKPIVFRVDTPDRIGDHTARLTELLSHFAQLNKVAKRVRTETLDAPTLAEVSELITLLRRVSKGAAEKADLIEIAHQERAS